MRYGFKPHSKFEIDNIDNGLCVWCGSKLEGRRTKYCSDKCMRTYSYAHSIGWMRDKFFSDSDKKCAKCRSDIIESGLGYDYVLDHIVPIALGGEEFNSDNFQILCNSCNKIKTKEDMKKIYEFKKCKGIAKLDSLLG